MTSEHLIKILCDLQEKEYSEKELFLVRQKKEHGIVFLVTQIAPLQYFLVTAVAVAVAEQRGSVGSSRRGCCCSSEVGIRHIVTTFFRREES